MSHRADLGALRPVWLTEAAEELRAILSIGFEKFGDDPPAIAAWIEKLHDYRAFWTLVERGQSVVERYVLDPAIQAEMAEAAAHPELRVPRPKRRTA